MSKNAHNGQRYVELFSPTNQDILKTWKVLSGVKKVYDEKLKTFVYHLKGKAPVPLMHWPKNKTNIVIDHPILIFQIYLAVGANVLFDIRVSCHNNLRKRITLSVNQKIARITLLSVILPLSVKNAGTWSHLLVDIEDVVSSVWKKESFRSIDSICLSGTCSIKRIFTLRRDMIQNQEGIQTIKYDHMPKQMLLSRNDSPIYNTIPCLNDSEKEVQLETPYFTSQLASTPSSSKSSGHFKVTKSTYGGSRRSTSKSAKSSGSISQTLSNKSEYSFCYEDVKSKNSIEEQDDRINGEQLLPLLSRLSFTDAVTESASRLVEVQSNRDLGIFNHKSLEMPSNLLLMALSSEFNGNLSVEDTS